MSRLHVSFLGKATWFATLIICLSMGLSGCSLLNFFSFSKKTKVIQQSPDGFPYRVHDGQDCQVGKLRKFVTKYNVRIITIGQDYLISIPSSELFPNESPRLTWPGYGVLNYVACYLKQYRKIAMTVTAFSDKCGSAKRDRVLTLARARAVGDYLWSQGIDSRFIFTQGLGSDKPIVSYTPGGDKSPNSRIEITFRDEVA